jgi:prepilin signal peptidase PulO-like enzyme (type II secretory pathway)
VDALLVAGAGAAGLLIGGALDPVGQWAAEQSRLDDERRRADLEPEPGAPELGGDRGERPESTLAHLEHAAEGAMEAAEADDADDPTPEDRTVGNLVPAGPAPVRTLGAALATGVLFAGSAAHFGRDLVLAPFCAFFAMLVVISVTDLSHRLVPRRLIYGGLALIVPLLVASAGVDHTWHSLTGAVIAGAVAFGLFFAIWWFIPRGMGFGDVRLAGAIGLTTGYLSLLHAYVAFLVGFVAGMVFGLVMMAVSSAGRKTRIPFAPSLSAGAAVAVFWGAQVAHGLFHTGS